MRDWEIGRLDSVDICLNDNGWCHFERRMSEKSPPSTLAIENWMGFLLASASKWHKTLKCQRNLEVERLIIEIDKVLLKFAELGRLMSFRAKNEREIPTIHTCHRKLNGISPRKRVEMTGKPRNINRPGSSLCDLRPNISSIRNPLIFFPLIPTPYPLPPINFLPE